MRQQSSIYLDHNATTPVDPQKVVLTPQHKEILDNICVKLGQSQSETLRIAFIEYARSISLVTEKVHSR